ncbi:3241_t:CDS:2 [Paraglomus occultum]|uniref:3241_t:CDS:1 n=1 Tax=Paraglomus occultum TaxID=144539 RepID=A0A9N9AMV8_9GLOM|nr:3241_t:CDS:2 [Paraglomus occultum]
MPEQTSTLLHSVTTARPAKNATDDKDPLNEENLKSHTSMNPPSKESKSQLVLSYVDLQRQLIALEAQLRRETEEERARFENSLPADTPAVIPEVITLPLELKSKYRHSIEDSESDYSIINHQVENPPPLQSIDAIPSLLDSMSKSLKRSQKLKIILKKTTQKIANKFNNRQDKDDEPSSPISIDKDIPSLRVEPSIPPSPSQLTIRSRASIPFPAVSAKHMIANDKPTHQRTDSADTMQTGTLTQISPRSSIHSPYSSVLCSPPQSPSNFIHSDTFPATQFTPNPLSPSVTGRYPDIGDANGHNNVNALASSPRSRTVMHENSGSSLFKRAGVLNNSKKDLKHEPGHRKEKSWSPLTVKEHEQELVAFRYPSVKDTLSIPEEVDVVLGGGIDVGINADTMSGSGADDGTMTGSGSCNAGLDEPDDSGASGVVGADGEVNSSKHKEKEREKERLVTFDLDGSYSAQGNGSVDIISRAEKGRETVDTYCRTMLKAGH